MRNLIIFFLSILLFVPEYPTFAQYKKTTFPYSDIPKGKLYVHSEPSGFNSKYWDSIYFDSIGLQLFTCRGLDNNPIAKSTCLKLTPRKTIGYVK